MYKLEYAPRAMDDMEHVKEYITLQHGANVAGKSLRRLTSSARRLEKFPEEGPGLEALILVPTDYRYLYIRPNYLFYRIEGNCVKVVRVLNEQQDFLQILFGIATLSDELEDDWEIVTAYNSHVQIVDEMRHYQIGVYIVKQYMLQLFIQNCYWRQKVVK